VPKPLLGWENDLIYGSDIVGPDLKPRVKPREDSVKYLQWVFLN
jgi:hypothetical protein